MRFRTVLLLFLVAPAALAQPCDPAVTDEVCPDTTDWRRYFPLAVGNEWQYRETFVFGEVDYWGWRITGETEVEGKSYFTLERCNETEDGSVSCWAPRLVRYHDDYALVVQYGEDGDAWWSGVPCGLGLPFNGPGMCEGPGAEGYYLVPTGSYASTPPPLGAPSDTRKTVDTPIFERISLYAGLGLVATEDEMHPEPTRLVYARIDGVEYGVSAFNFPTSNEPDEARPAATAFTGAFPNPALGAMRAGFTLAEPQTVTLELIDLLGRRVRETDLGPRPAGAHDLRLDLGGLRPGLYVLRLRGDAGAEATQRVVVVR